MTCSTHHDFLIIAPYEYSYILIYLLNYLGKVVKVKWIYIAPSRERSKALRHGSHSVTCQQHHACPPLVSIHLMVPPQTEAVNI